MGLGCRVALLLHIVVKGERTCFHLGIKPLKRNNIQLVGWLIAGHGLNGSRGPPAQRLREESDLIWLTEWARWAQMLEGFDRSIRGFDTKQSAVIRPVEPQANLFMAS